MSSCRSKLVPSFAFSSALALALSLPALAADVTKPGRVAGLFVERSADGAFLTWTPVATDAAGQPELVDFYAVYRGTTPDFVPDTANGTNRIGSATVSEFLDSGALLAPESFFYRVTAIDAAGNESTTRNPLVASVPVLSGSWTDTSIALSWTSAEPVANVAGYRVYYGKRPGVYESVDDVGLATSHTLTGLELLVNWYVAVTAVDIHGNETAFSNEHVDAIAGRVRTIAHDKADICWGASGCPPKPGYVQRSNGQEILVPVDFPEGEWTRVLLTFTADAGLYNDVPDKCGSNNPGWNPGGDPWDRTASVYLVEDDCVDTGATCFGRLGNVELLRTITPFGTDDKRPPEGRGSGVVPARTWTFDITPLVPLLEGRKYIGVFIGVFVSAGWDTYVRFDFSERADEASPEPPADGVAKVFFHDGGNLAQSFPVTIPASATQVKARVFTTGHGGNQFCDGGSRNGLSCAGGCPGGSCQNCDEFCHRENQILINDVVRWSQVPWRDDCSPGSIFACQSWNACGWPSCTFSRAGWCPGYIACHKSGTCDQDIDFTQWLTPGATHQLRYNIPVVNGSWTKSVIVYWYE